MSKDRMSAKSIKSEGPPVSQPSPADVRLQSLRQYAKPRRIRILTADEGRQLGELMLKAGLKPVVRKLNDYGISYRLGQFEVVSEL